MKGDKTRRNLWEAFAGESQACRRYLAFAEAAQTEGHPQVARLFRAAAAAEALHARMHLQALGAVGDTAANLQAAIDGETEEFTALYPAMIRDAVEESQAEALRSFTFASAAEKNHAGLCRDALANLGRNPDADYHLCKVCGLIRKDAPTEPCAVCAAPASAFSRVD